jgi:hypothetical protein
MKKIFTLLLSSLFSISLFAFDGVRLSISAPGAGTQLKVEVDGREFSMQNNTVTLGYLSAGTHQVKIYKEAKKNFMGFARRNTIYSSMVTLHNGFHTDITVNRFGKVMQDEERIDSRDDYYEDSDDYYDNSNGGWDNSQYSQVMGLREFNDLKEQLRKEWFENNRMNSVKVILDKTMVTTAQVVELMDLFTFESNRLDLAKYAYCKTVDQKNYLKVMNDLTFSSSKDELARFIRDAH